LAVSSRDRGILRSPSSLRMTPREFFNKLLRPGLDAGFFFFGVHEAELLHFIAEGIAADIKQASGVGLVAASLTESKLDQRAFDFLERGAAFGDREWREPAAVGERLPTGRRRRGVFERGHAGMRLRH